MTANPFVILYVEDDDLARELFGDLLATAERRVVGVASGAAAREALRAHDVNLLITDVQLPDGSGLEVARDALRQNPALPVIICSGHDAADSARSLGDTAHALRKPVDVAELEALIDRLAR